MKCVVCGAKADYIYEGSTYCHKHYVIASETDAKIHSIRKRTSKT